MEEEEVEGARIQRKKGKEEGTQNEINKPPTDIEKKNT